MTRRTNYVAVIAVVLLLGIAYWFGSYMTAAQMGSPSSTQTQDPMMRIAAALERMAGSMEQMDDMGSGMMGGMMQGSGMMGQNGSGMGSDTMSGAGMMESMGSMMQEMQMMMDQMHSMMQNHGQMQGQMGNMLPAQPMQPSAEPSEIELTKTAMMAGVRIAVTYMNPLMKPEETSNQLIFKIALDTHSEDLMQFDLPKLAQVRNDEGVQINSGFMWEPINETEHHREGLLRVNAVLNGQQLITNSTKYIELELTNILPTSQRFRWEASLWTNKESN